MIIGVSGGIKTGKRQVCQQIINSLALSDVVLLSMGDYLEQVDDVDHPCAEAYNNLISTLRAVKEKCKLTIVYGKDLFLHVSIRSLVDFKIYLDVDPDTRLSNYGN